MTQPDQTGRDNTAPHDTTFSIFIVSFSRDIPFLPGLFKSISKFVMGVDEVVLLLPPKDKPLIDGFGLTKERVVFADEPLQDGHVCQQLFKCYADKWCKGQYVFHVDSDCLFTAPTEPRNYFHYGKPILLGTRYDTMNGASPWRPCTEVCLGESCEWETMRRLPIVYHRDTYPAFRSHVKAVHGMELADYLRPLKGITAYPIQSFSEFNAVGSFAWSHQPHLYYLWDTTKAEPTPSNLAQWWSRGGVDWKMDHAPFEGKSFREVSEMLLK